MMTAIRDRLRRARDDERGYLEVVAPFGLLLVLIVLGMVHDGGRMMMAKRDALNTAASAARAGAMEIDELHYRATGQVRVDAAKASAAITDYFAGEPGMDLANVEIAGTEVTVVAETHWEPSIIKNLGVQGRTVEGEVSSDVLKGIDSAD